MIILHNIDFDVDLYDRLKGFISDKKLITSQDGLHFGNYCLINIPDKLKQEIFEVFKNEVDHNKIQYRNKKTLIEKEDFNQYIIGEKITIEFLETDLFPVTNRKGTIHQITDSKIVVRAYRSKIKGWNIAEYSNVKIKKGW